jgi:hypothetical protein
MEVAETFLSAPVTVRYYDLTVVICRLLSLIQMLRRYGCFSRTLYANPTYPLLEDDFDTTEVKWRAWVRQESLKRFASLKHLTLVEDISLIQTLDLEQRYLPFSLIFDVRWRT